MFKFRNLFPEVKVKVSEYIFKDVIHDAEVKFNFVKKSIVQGDEGDKIDVKKLKMCCIHTTNKYLIDKKHSALLVLLKDKSVDIDLTRKNFFSIERFFANMHTLYYLNDNIALA